MRLFAAAALTMMSAACTTTPEPGIEIREVEVAVPQPCLTEEELAALPEPALVGPLTGLPENAEEERDKLAVSALRLRAWGRTLMASHVACASVRAAVLSE